MRGSRCGHAGIDLLESWQLACKGICTHALDVQSADGGSTCFQPRLQETPSVRAGGHQVLRDAAQRSEGAPQTNILHVQQRAAKRFAHKRQTNSRPAQAWDRELNESRRSRCGHCVISQHRSVGSRLGIVLLLLRALYCVVTSTTQSRTCWWRAHIAKGCSGAPTRAGQAARVTLASLDALAWDASTALHFRSLLLMNRLIIIVDDCGRPPCKQLAFVHASWREHK